MIRAIVFFLLAQLFVVIDAYGAPFTCSGDVYQVQSGQLKIFDPLTSTYVNIGSPTTGYNATGFNALDNYAYGTQSTNLIRINSDGTTNTLFTIGAATSNSADMDASNNLVYRGNASGPTTSLKKINISTGVIQSFTITGGSITANDMVWRSFAGIEYMFGFTSLGQLERINLSTNALTLVSVSGLPTATGYGATWTDSAGRIFTFSNGTGIIYEVKNYLTASPTAVQVATGTPSSSNDGFSCPGAPFPNLSPLAFNDAFTTPFGTAVSGNVLSNNGSGADNDPEGTALTVTTTPVAGPTNGLVTLAATGAFTYTPNPGYFGNDTFTYQIADASGQTATAVVTITTSPPVANLVTVKTRSSSTATPSVGDTVTFKIVVTNNGPNTVPNPTLTDTLPSGLTYTGNTASQGTYASGTGLWSVGSLANGASATLTLSGTVNAGQQGLTKTNTTTAANGGNTDSTNVGDDLVEAITVSNLSHTVTKVQSSGPAATSAPGQIIGYTISVANTGNGSLSSVSVTDTLQLGGSARTLTTGPTKISGDTNSNNILDVGETWIYSASYTTTQADLNGSGSLTNTANAQTAQTALLISTPAVSTGVTRTSQLSIVKTADKSGPLAVGTLITYSYAVTNTGNVTMTGVNVSDTHNGALPIGTPNLEQLTTDAVPLSDSTDAVTNDALWTTLGPADTVTFKRSYTVQQADIDALQ